MANMQEQLSDQIPPSDRMEKETSSRGLDSAKGCPVSVGRDTDLEVQEDNDEKVIVYLTGWRLHTLTVAYGEPLVDAIIKRLLIIWQAMSQSVLIDY